MVKIPDGIGYIAAYLGGVATVVALQAIQPQPKVVVVPGAASILARPPVTADQAASAQPLPLRAELAPQEKQPEKPIVSDPVPVESAPALPCLEDADCKSPTTVCLKAYGVCAALHEPTCSCGQADVLRCFDASNHTKFTFCEKGCSVVPGGARCL